MFLRFLILLASFSFSAGVIAQENYTLIDDLRDNWMTYRESTFEPLTDLPFTGLNTIYFQLDPASSSGNFLTVSSAKPYFLFVNGKVLGEYQGESMWRIDSLVKSVSNRVAWVAIHQDKINERDLRTQVVSRGKPEQVAAFATPVRPYSHFRDFVVISGFLIIVFFVVAIRLNSKLASDYFSVRAIVTARDADDGQTSARLTGGANVQFYILCSLLIGFYLLIVLFNLPSKYALPVNFRANGFWSMWGQWLKLSSIVFLALIAKLMIIFALTRLFGMRGMARFHFFNWIRLLLVIAGVATVVLFMYFIGRGDRPEYYVTFLLVLVAILVIWIVIAFFKLSGRSEHSMFHLFSYLCATELIPLLITVKVLFQ